MPMSKKQKKRIKRRGAENLVRVGKKAGKAVVGAAAAAVGWHGIIPRAAKKVGKAGSCVAKGMKRGLSLSAASEACGITKKVRKPLKIKRSKGKSRMTKDVKKV